MQELPPGEQQEILSLGTWLALVIFILLVFVALIVLAPNL